MGNELYKLKGCNHTTVKVITSHSMEKLVNQGYNVYLAHIAVSNSDHELPTRIPKELRPLLEEYHLIFWKDDYITS